MEASLVCDVLAVALAEHRPPRGLMFHSDWGTAGQREAAKLSLEMRRKDRKFFEGLPKTLTIYRGYQHGIHRHKMGLSWTLSKEKAVWFAYRRPENGKPMVALGRCRKADVFCYTNGREEDEIIIDPAHITNVRTLKDIGPSPFEHH